MADEFADAKVLFTLRSNSDAITTVAFLGTPDGQKLAVADGAGQVLIYALTC